MTLRTRIQTLSAAALLALAVVGMSAGPADAKPRKPVDTGVRCSVPGAMGVPPSDEDFEFYMPGEYVTVRDNSGSHRILRCNPDGTWTVVMAPASAGAGARAPRPSVIGQ